MEYLFSSSSASQFMWGRLKSPLMRTLGRVSLEVIFSSASSWAVLYRFRVVTGFSVHGAIIEGSRPRYLNFTPNGFSVFTL